MEAGAAGRAFHAELAWLGGTNPVARDVLIDTRGGRIVGLHTDVAASEASDAVRLGGLTLPGLANVHSHSFQRALRGRTHGATGSFWTWRDQMYALAARLQPEALYDLALATFTEMALAGITCVGEFHYLHHAPGGTPYADPNEMGHAVVAAAGVVGVRLTLLDAVYLSGGLTDAGQERPLDSVQQRFSDGTVEGWARRVDELSLPPAARLGAAVHSVRAVPQGALAPIRKWATERGAVVHAHVSEQPAENEQCVARYGATPTEVLDAAGLLSERFTAVHATHLTAHDVATLGRAAATCCVCPTTERDLADGVGRFADLSTAGIALALGSDSQAVIDIFEEARSVEFSQRLASLRRGVYAPPDLATMATANGYAALGWPDGGRLAVGALADMTTVGLHSVRLRGTQADDALPAVIFGATAADVRHTVVGGELVVRDGAHVRIDAGAALERALTAVEAAR